MTRTRRDPWSADSACAYIVPALLLHETSSAQQLELGEALVVGILHPVHEVRSNAAAGISLYGWANDSDFVRRTVGVLADEASEIDKRCEDWRQSEASQRDKQTAQSYGEIVRDVGLEARMALCSDDGVSTGALAQLDPDSPEQARALTDILTILAGNPNAPEAVATFARVSSHLATLWSSEDRRDRYDRRRDFELEHTWQQKVVTFLFRTSLKSANVVTSPILTAVATHPREAAWFLRELIVAEDQKPDPQRFWCLWDSFSQAVKDAPWLHRVDTEYAHDAREMLQAIFLAIGWKKSAHHWSSLDYEAGRLAALFEAIPTSAASLSSYVSYLYAIGEQALPNAFVVLAGQLRGDAGLVPGTNTVLMLEVLLQRNVYGRPLELKKDRQVRDAVLVLLDLLIEAGSSSAFRMRDDFVTPLPARDV